MVKHVVVSVVLLLTLLLTPLRAGIPHRHGADAVFPPVEQIVVAVET